MSRYRFVGAEKGRYPVTRLGRMAQASRAAYWLEALYYRQRRYSAIDMLSAVDYQERYWDRCAAA